MTVQLGPSDGDRAFECHMLLAARIHRAVGLWKTRNDSDTDAWVKFFSDFCPVGRNNPVDARLLFKSWRTRLLKDQYPGHGIAITHGQRHVHWETTDAGLAINLESMWDDFTVAVDKLVEWLETDIRRKKVVTTRWHERQWTVREIRIAPSTQGGGVPTAMVHTTASASSGGSVFKLVKPPD